MLSFQSSFTLGQCGVYMQVNHQNHAIIIVVNYRPSRRDIKEIGACSHDIFGVYNMRKVAQADRGMNSGFLNLDTSGGAGRSSPTGYGGL